LTGPKQGVRGIVLQVNFWLVKQEPSDYSWADLVRDGGTAWTGVRNFQARNNLRAMKRNDLVFFYHSGEEKQVVGLARVTKEAYPDPTANDGDWSCVDLKPGKVLKAAVGLNAIKSDGLLKAMALLRQSRLSVVPLTSAEADRLLDIAETRL